MILGLRKARRIKLARVLGATTREWSVKRGVVILLPGTVPLLVSMLEGGKQTCPLGGGKRAVPP
jgi:hypothetical protein